MPKISGTDFVGMQNIEFKGWLPLKNFFKSPYIEGEKGVHHIT